MSVDDLTACEEYFHPSDPAGWLKPDEPFFVDGLDWSWAFVVYEPIVGFLGYRVGSNGTIWTSKTQDFVGIGRGIETMIGGAWKRLKARFRDRRCEVELFKNGERYCRFVHRLVLEAFVGPRPAGMECCHRDDNKGNNRSSNLRWDTHQANVVDAKRNGRIRRGERNGQAKLTADQVRAIRDAHSRGEANQPQLAERYGISQVMVSKIIRRLCWGHIV